MRASPSARSALLVAVVALVVGCGDDPADVDPTPEPTISPTTQWAGGVVRVSIAGLDPDEVAPDLRLDGEPLPVAEVGDGWADYRLPESLRGAVTLDLAGGDPATFDVDVLGFREAYTVGRALRGNLFVWPRTGPASVLGLASDNTGVIQVLPGARTAEYLLEDSVFTESRSVGPTYDPDVLLVSKGTPELWRLLPTPELVDALPTMEFSRHAMLLSDSVFVTSWHHGIDTYDPRESSGSRYIGQYEESQRMVISPSGRYGVVEINGSALGVPVFDGDGWEPAFHVDTISHSDGVDFSPVGDTLYVAGYRQAEPRIHLLLAVDATSGAVVDGLELAAYNPVSVARDPHGPRLFVLAISGEVPVLLVVDTRTMQIVGEMASEGYLGCPSGCEGVVAVGPDGVYFVTTQTSPAREGDTIPAAVLAFDGWPVQ